MKGVQAPTIAVANPITNPAFSPKEVVPLHRIARSIREAMIFEDTYQVN